MHHKTIFEIIYCPLFFNFEKGFQENIFFEKKTDITEQTKMSYKIKKENMNNNNLWNFNSIVKYCKKLSYNAITML